MRHSTRLHKTAQGENEISLPTAVTASGSQSSGESEASVSTIILQRTTAGSPRWSDQQLQLSEEIGISTVDQAVPEGSQFDELWNPLETQPWWLEQDLNLEAFDTSLFDPNGLDEPWFQPLNQDPAGERVTPMLSDLSGQHFVDSKVQQAWFTYVGGPYNRDVSKLFQRAQPECQESSDSFDLGASFRARVSQRLTTQQNIDPLPSTPYLVSQESLSNKPL